MASPTVSSTPRTYYEPQATYGHSSSIIDEMLYSYGGWYKGVGTDPPTTVEIFDITRRRWEQKPTVGRPPPGFISATCATIGSSIYYVGGRNGITYFNSIHCLDTLTLRWNEVVPSNPQESPIPKAGAAMFSYLGKRLVTFGGYGLIPVTAVEELYVPDPQHDNKKGWTSELHYFDTDNRTWTSPQTTGSPPPACSGCSLTRVDENRAVLFGSYQLYRLVDNHVYILELQSWTWITVRALPGQPWPVHRMDHSAVSLHDPNSAPSDPALMMLWGTGGGNVVLSDAWNFSVNTQQWKQVILPDSLRGRAQHTTSAVYHDLTHKQLVTHGGYHAWPKDDHGQLVSVNHLVPVTATTIVELEHTPSRDWVVGDIIRISQTGRSVETVIQPGAMSSPTPQIEMEQLNRKLAKEVQEYKSSLAHSQQTQQSLTLVLAEKELQLSSRPAKMIELQATLDRERGQREEGEKQLKTKENELHDMQLKVEELQEEKEKLEGQLQSSQDSIKEIQQQLTSPEKCDRAIQTHREPSFLQISAQTAQERRDFQATVEQRETQLDWERRRREEVEQQLKDKQRILNEMQLQINELQEREKLAGQPQSSQTGETLATLTTETQEELSQSERRDHKGPLPATQATGEATTTTKEIQEQLTPPGRRDQSVQTYTEPPFFQTSEALQLRGVHVVGEKTFTVTGDSPTTFNWEEYGFTLHIPEGALPPDVDQCHIHIKATIRGQFQLPDDHKLVSAVFWIWCRHKLSKPATMEIEHCAAITTDKQCSALTFVRAHCSQEELPYTFVPIPEGVFTPGSCYGSISLSQFSGFAIACRKYLQRMYTMVVNRLKRGHTSPSPAKRMKLDHPIHVLSIEAVLPDETSSPMPTSEETTSTQTDQTSSPTPMVLYQSRSPQVTSQSLIPETTVSHTMEDDHDSLPPERHCARLYCAHKGGSWWLLYFVLLRDLKADMQAVNTYFTGKATLEIESIKLTLEEDKITLDIPMEGVTQEGWKVMPCYCPTITKEDTHHFLSGSSMPALCELQAEWQHDQRRPHRLSYPTKIIGACPPRNYFLLTVTPVVESGLQSLSPPHDGPSTGATRDVHHPVFVFALDASKVCDILQECRFSFADWDLLAHRLCTDIDVKSLRQTQYNHERCLYETICQWLHKDREASWRKLADAVGRISAYGHVVTEEILKKVGSN